MRDTAGLGAAGNPRTVTYSYDKNGNLLMKTDASTIQYGFDDLGRPVTKTYYDGTAPVTYCYDGDNASSHSLTRGFANVPISWSCAGAPTTVANLKQRLTMVVGDHSTTTYSSYDEFGAPLSSQQTTNGVTYPAFSYSYNWLGSLLSETYPSGRKLNWAYDTTDARPTGVSASSPAVVTYASILPAGFWPSGAVKTMNLAGNNAFTEASTLDYRMRPTSLSLASSSVTESLGLTWTNGNLTQEVVTNSLNPPALTQSFKYDNLSRLISAAEVQGPTTTWSQNYGYDN